MTSMCITGYQTLALTETVVSNETVMDDRTCWQFAGPVIISQRISLNLFKHPSEQTPSDTAIAHDVSVGEPIIH